MQLSEAAEVVGGTLTGGDVPFRGLSTDSRTLPRGALFVALRGARFDAHDFLSDACKAGAGALMVERNVAAPLPAMRVGNTRVALGRLAAAWRDRLPLQVVGVTGSNGKTTVKEMLRAVLSQRGAVLATRGNLNNDIGVPLTLAELGENHRYAVIEMGANHPGEIAYLAGLAAPCVGVVTQCAPAHLEGFGSVEGVARAKGELFAALSEDGTAVINADDAHASLWRRMAGARPVLDFGLEQPAAVSAEGLQLEHGGSRFRLLTPAGSASVHLPLAGRHNVMNALAAAACACALATEPEAIAEGLAGMQPVRGRLEEFRGRRGCRLLDDTYNANPGSLNAALAVLRGFPGEHWLVLGDMGELGSAAANHHAAAGRLAKAQGIVRLFALGPLSREAVQSFGRNARHFSDMDELLEAMQGDLGDSVTVLVKGSRAMHMERVVESLRERGA